MPTIMIILMRHFRRHQGDSAGLFPIADSAIDRRIRFGLVFGFTALMVGAAVAESLGWIR
jgi:hypothetical protein